MTRARDRLYVAGFENKNGRAKGCWYDLISSALSQRESPGTASVIRITSSQTEPHETPKATTQDDLAGTPLPAWAATPAPREPQLSVPLAPSRLAPYEVDETGEPSPAPPPKDSLAEPASPSPALQS